MAHTLKISVCGSRGDPASPRDLPKCNVLSAGLSRYWTPPVCHALNHMREIEESPALLPEAGGSVVAGGRQASVCIRSCCPRSQCSLRRFWPWPLPVGSLPPTCYSPEDFTLCDSLGHLLLQRVTVLSYPLLLPVTSANFLGWHQLATWSAVLLVHLQIIEKPKAPCSGPRLCP